MNIAIIPARKKSHRIKNKNIKNFNGKPILYWSILAAKKSKLFKDIYVSTDSKRIANLAIKFGAKACYPRSSKLSNAYATIIDVIKYEIKLLEKKKIKFNNICCIFAAAPFIKSTFLTDGFKLIKKKKFKGFVFAGNKIEKKILRSFHLENNKLNLINSKYMNIRTQDLPNSYIDAGQFYWGSKSLWKNKKSIFTKDSSVVVLPRSKSVDIDTMKDWKEAQLYAKKR